MTPSRESPASGWAVTGPISTRTGNRITDRDEIDRLNAIGLPPAYTDAWFCADPNGHLQATGIDARGRKQYRYHAEFRARRESAKYEGLLEFGKALPRLRRRVEQDLKRRNLAREAVLAAVVRLLDTEHIRIGNEEYARENKSFGATTLRSRHLKRKGQGLMMRFTGKHGIVHEVKITDTNLKRICKRCQELPGQMLFQYVNGDGEPKPITSGDVNDYIKEATRRRLHRQAFPHLERERDRLRADAEEGRGRADHRQDGGRTCRRSARQHAGDQPQVLCPPEAARGREGGSARSARRDGAAAGPQAAVDCRSRAARVPRTRRKAPPQAHRHLKASCRRLIATSLAAKTRLMAVDKLSTWFEANRDGLLIGLVVAVVLVAVMLVLREFGRRALARDPEGWGWRSVIGRVLAKTSLAFMVLAAADVVSTYADLPHKIARLVDILFIIAFALQGAVWARELILGLIGHRVARQNGSGALGNAMAIIRVLVSVALFAIAGILILDNLGVNVTALVAGLGIGGIAIGLAAQGIFSDLFAALSILFDKPFKKGDTIRYDSSTGTVERIGLKTTRLRSITGEQLIMANTKLLEREIHNLAQAKARRITLYSPSAAMPRARAIDAVCGGGRGRRRRSEGLQARPLRPFRRGRRQHSPSTSSMTIPAATMTCWPRTARQSFAR